MDDLDRAVRTVVERCLAVGAGDDVLVVADPGTAELCDALLHAARAACGASTGIGGTVTVPVHEDVVVLDASLWIGDTHVLDAGRWLPRT